MIELQSAHRAKMLALLMLCFCSFVLEDKSSISQDPAVVHREECGSKCHEEKLWSLEEAKGDQAMF